MALCGIFMGIRPCYQVYENFDKWHFVDRPQIPKKSFKKIFDKKINFQNEIGPWINSRLRKRKPKSRMLRFGRFVFHRDVREYLSDWSALPGFILESKKCTGDCEDSYVQCIIDCKAGTDCQSRCARDYTNCNEHCPCYNFCYEGKLTLDQGSTDVDQRRPNRGLTWSDQGGNFGPHDSLLAINLEKEIIGIFRCSFSIWIIGHLRVIIQHFRLKFIGDTGWKHFSIRPNC